MLASSSTPQALALACWPSGALAARAAAWVPRSRAEQSPSPHLHAPGAQALEHDPSQQLCSAIIYGWWSLSSMRSFPPGMHELRPSRQGPVHKDIKPVACGVALCSCVPHSTILCEIM